MSDYDAIVIGGNTPGLVTAAYLGKDAGLKTLVLEKSPYIGGTAITTDKIVPGFKFHPAATGEFYVDPVMDKDLQLTEHGLVGIDADPKLTSLYPDGTNLSFYNDLNPTIEEIKKFSETDAQAYRAFYQKWAKMADMFAMGTRNAPVPFSQFTAAMSATPEMEDMLRDMLFGTITDVLDRTFENQKVKAAFLPYSEGVVSGPSTAGFFIATGRVAQHWGFIKGGLTNVAKSCRDAAERYGATVRANSEVSKILIRDGKAFGVRLADGTEITADSVISELVLPTTFFDLVGSDQVPDDFIQKVKGIRFECSGVTMNLALSELPDFNIPEQKYHGFLGVYPSYEFGEKAFYEASVGELPENPVCIGYMPSVYDPDSHFAPEGQHVLTQFVFPAPFPGPRKSRASLLWCRCGQSVRSRLQVAGGSQAA